MVLKYLSTQYKIHLKLSPESNCDKTFPIWIQNTTLLNFELVKSGISPEVLVAPKTETRVSRKTQFIHRTSCVYISLTRRYICACDWLRGGEVVFPRSTDCVRVVAVGELTLCERLISWAADVVARLILKQRKVPNHTGRDGDKRNKNKSTYWGVEAIFHRFSLYHAGDQEERNSCLNGLRNLN